ncbi:Protein glass, partial [Stegodyphus mimosarum]
MYDVYSDTDKLMPNSHYQTRNGNYGAGLDNKREPPEKKYQCGICSYMFRSMSHLKSHLLIHTGERPFDCPICGKSFNQRSHVTSHVQTHTKPFKCKICDRRFSRKQLYVTHIMH